MSNGGESLFTTLENEALICGRCGYCRSACPVYRVIGWESSSPRGKISLAREIFAQQNTQLTDQIVQRLSQCTLCGACAIDCSTSIDTRKLWLELRRRIADLGQEPPAYTAIKNNLLARKNISSFDNDDRLDWAQDLDDPEAVEPRAGAEVCYFVGCVSSFFPQTAQIPLAVAEILTRAGVDFTTMGGEEWCCGFPLIGSGFVGEAERFIEHNVEKLKELDIHTLIASCASCYQVWKHDSQAALQGYDLEVLHTTEYLARLIQAGQLPLGEIEETIAYHDPCDLGRNGGVYDAPRQIVQAIPGATLVELQHHHENSLCCGGGGNLQSVDPENALKITELRVEEIKASGASIVVSACQQCQQMLLTAVKKAKLPVRVMDISQLLLEAME